MDAHEHDLAGCVVLLVDDEKTILLPLRDSLRDAGAEVLTATTGDQAVDILAEREPHIVITDVRMPGLSGLDVLAHVRRYRGETEVVLMTAFANVEHAVEAIKRGAYDYVTKPFPNEKIVRMAEKIWALRRLRSEVSDLRARSGTEPALGFLIGSSDAWRSTIKRVRMAAATDSTVLVIGESGTGKELIARALHLLSERQRGPLIKVHCAALPPTLMESELFGHVRGAFTGATQESKGRFELASGGTLLLDEVDEIPMDVQVKLLRVIQERVIERVGSGQPIEVDVRLLATSKGRLEELVEQGRFRQDLFYRLSVVQIRLPRLAERRADIPALLDHFLATYGRRSTRDCAGFTREATEALLAYDFPGNVRELEHIVEAACALSDGKPIGVDLLPDTIERRPARSELRVGFAARPLAEAMEQFERSYLEHAVREFDGARAELANVLGISRKSLWQKLKRYGIEAEEE